jgi:hypothetical protein
VGGERVNNWRLSPCFYLSRRAGHTEIYSIKCVLVLPVTLVKGRRKYWACKSDFALLLWGRRATAPIWSKTKGARHYNCKSCEWLSRLCIFKSELFREQREFARSKRRRGIRQENKVIWPVDCLINSKAAKHKPSHLENIYVREPC